MTIKHPPMVGVNLANKSQFQNHKNQNQNDHLKLATPATDGWFDNFTDSIKTLFLIN
jgi:hypothetical protein